MRLRRRAAKQGARPAHVSTATGASTSGTTSLQASPPTEPRSHERPADIAALAARTEPTHRDIRRMWEYAAARYRKRPRATGRGPATTVENEACRRGGSGRISPPSLSLSSLTCSADAGVLGLSLMAGWCGEGQVAMPTAQPRRAAGPEPARGDGHPGAHRPHHGAHDGDHISRQLLRHARFRASASSSRTACRTAQEPRLQRADRRAFHMPSACQAETEPSQGVERQPHRLRERQERRLRARKRPRGDGVTDRR